MMTFYCNLMVLAHPSHPLESFQLISLVMRGINVIVPCLILDHTLQIMSEPQILQANIDPIRENTYKNKQ